MKKFATVWVVLLFATGCGGSGEAVPPTTTLPPTTTTAAPLTTADLLGALPTVLNLPSGWSSSGDPVTSLDPKTGEGFGICGKGNEHSRAIANNMVAFAGSPSFRTTEGGWSRLGLYSFGTEEDAEGFVALTVSQANCPDGLEYEQEEGENWEDGLVDLFLHADMDGQVWTHLEHVSLGSASGGDADEAFFITSRNEYLTNTESGAYGNKDSRITIYERHGRLVISHATSGACCSYGYSNVDATDDYTPKFDEVSASLDILRPHVLDALPDK